MARITSCGTYARQRRRRESAGIAAADRHRIYMHAETGLVSQVFDKARELLSDTIAMYRKIGMPKHVVVAEAMLGMV